MSYNMSEIINDELREQIKDIQNFIKQSIPLLDYSAENILLILRQYPNANNLKSYKEWKNENVEFVDIDNITIQYDKILNGKIVKEEGYLFDVKQTKKENSIPCKNVYKYTDMQIADKMMELLYQRNIDISIVGDEIRYDEDEDMIYLFSNYNKDVVKLYKGILNILIDEKYSDLVTAYILTYFGYEYVPEVGDWDVDFLKQARVYAFDYISELNNQVAFDCDERLILLQIETDNMIEWLLERDERRIVNKIYKLNNEQIEVLKSDILNERIPLSEPYLFRV